MKPRFKIGQKVVWVNCYGIEYFGNTGLKNKLKNGLLTGTVKETDEYGRCFIVFDDDLREFLEYSYLNNGWSTNSRQVKENGFWEYDNNNYKVRPLNGIELMAYKAKIQ